MSTDHKENESLMTCGDFSIRYVRDTDRQAVTDVFNYFVENSFAAYPTSKVSPVFYDHIARNRSNYPFYVIEDGCHRVVGFGLLQPHHPADGLRRTGELTYFLLPEASRQGIGSRLLGLFEDAARLMGIDTVVASVSSLNNVSIGFHRKHGFVECGRLRKVGFKFEEDFDVVWFQKFL